MLDDFTPANGATRVVPGSHKYGAPPQKQQYDTTRGCPPEIFSRLPPGRSICSALIRCRGTRTDGL